ncbi:hypothetical protein QAD02_023032 [Eretmocerus hayati]|uniref:Uncharacterized protein n=1 Tax=Eretmocerus hayati TaxID=131215 RepID=A0ACC2PWB0_9HYME|nr:hypothetical protein QAD02_023032 [Eretmocerus hayati]
MCRGVSILCPTILVLCTFAATSCGARFTPRLILGGSLDAVHQDNSTNNNILPSSDSLDECDTCVCGVSRQVRIVNGDTTNTNEFPWAVAIEYQGLHHCGASLITRKHLVSAAHCFYGFAQNQFGLRLPDNEEYHIASIKIHELYDKQTFNNDIAIIELDRRIPMDGPASTVCLPRVFERFNYIGSTGVAIGWGRLGEGRPLSLQLRKVELPIMSEEECLRSEYPKTRVTRNMFCAGYLEGKKDSCAGDSGGAFNVRKGNGAMDLVGIVSFGRGCARPKFPGVYTKVSNYLSWIDRQIQHECKCLPPRDPHSLNNE